MAKSLNRVQLIGNLTRDPELRYTPSGSALCSFGIATNRSWTTDAGERKDEADFHNIVAWRKLAEICSQYLKKGSKVYVEGRLSTRQWTAQDGTQKNRTEIVIEDMIMLDGRGQGAATQGEGGYSKPQPKSGAKPKEEQAEAPKEPANEAPRDNEDEVSPDDIPF